MKRLVLLCILLLTAVSGLWAQVPASGRYGGAVPVSRSSNILEQTGRSTTDEVVYGDLPKTAAGAVDKSSSEYYKWRLQQLQRSLYEKTRREVVREKSDAKVQLRSEMSGKRFDELNRHLRDVVEPVAESEIEDEVQKRLGSEVMLDKFGKAFFDEGEMAQATLFASSAPSDYRLGPGDELKIIIWSEMGDETVYDVKVNPEGQVYVPILGILGVAGSTVGEFEQIVIGRLTGKFKHFKGQATLSKVRTIQIFVVGEVEKPGAMTASGLATAFTALYQAGGPTERGSMRQIKVLDSAGKAKEIDLYRYLLSGDRSQDVPLANGDTVFVPTVSAQVSISGMVTRPAVYEITENTTLAQGLIMAGNVQAKAYSGRVKITRWSGDRRRQTYDISLGNQAELAGFMLMNGDEIIVERAIEKVGNEVEIAGSITRPGKYAWAEGMKVADLITRAGGLIKEETSPDHAQVIRKSLAGKEELITFNPRFAMLDDEKQNVALLPLDRVVMFAEHELKAEKRFINIDGAVRRPGQYVYREGMKLADLIMNAQGLALDAVGDVEIARASGGNESEILKVDAHAALVREDADDNVKLQPLDRVSVMARGEGLIEAEVVVIKGQVRKPGPYALKYRGEKVSSLIARAGGLTGQAFPEGVVFMRRTSNLVADKQLETAERVQREMFRQANQDLRADLLRYGANLENLRASGLEAGGTSVAEQIKATSQQVIGETPGKSAADQETSRYGDIEMRSRLIDQPFLRVPLPLKEILDGKAEDFEDLALLDGDQLVIPAVPQTVSVIGAVVNPNTILFSENRNVRYYIDRAGGFNSRSDHRRTVIVKANGEVVPMRKVRSINRGDIVLVPPKPRTVRPDSLKEMASVASILGNLAVAYKVVKD